MIGLPTTATSRISRDGTSAWSARPATSLAKAARTARVISPAPSGCIIA